MTAVKGGQFLEVADGLCSRGDHSCVFQNPVFIEPLLAIDLDCACGVVMQQVTDNSFEADVLKAPGPVLVDFWAEWCGPCRQVAPILESLAVDMSDRLTVAKLNIDENPATPSKYGVRGIPTLILFKAGQVVSTKVGALPRGKLYEWVEQSL